MTSEMNEKVIIAVGPTMGPTGGPGVMIKGEGGETEVDLSNAEFPQDPKIIKKVWIEYSTLPNGKNHVASCSNCGVNLTDVSDVQKACSLSDNCKMKLALASKKEE